MKLLACWLAFTVVAILVALLWGYATRPRLHRTPAPGAGDKKVQPCPACGHIPYFEAPDACDTCGGTGFVTNESKETAYAESR